MYTHVFFYFSQIHAYLFHIFLSEAQLLFHFWVFTYTTQSIQVTLKYFYLFSENYTHVYNMSWLFPSPNRTLTAYLSPNITSYFLTQWIACSLGAHESGVIYSDMSSLLVVTLLNPIESASYCIVLSDLKFST